MRFGLLSDCCFWAPPPQRRIGFSTCRAALAWAFDLAPVLRPDRQPVHGQPDNRRSVLPHGITGGADAKSRQAEGLARDRFLDDWDPVTPSVNYDFSVRHRRHRCGKRPTRPPTYLSGPSAVVRG